MYATRQCYILPWVLLAAIVAAAGCQPAPHSDGSGSGAKGAGTLAANRSPAEAPRKEYWDVLFFEKSKVGYAHTIYAHVEDEGRTLVRISADSEISMHRYGQTTRQTISYSSLETPEGELVRFESKMSSGNSTAGTVDTSTRGIAQGNKLAIEISTRGKVLSSEVPWDRSWGGFFRTEQSLERSPLKPGETRSLRALMPGLNVVADVTFSAAEYEQTEVLNGQMDLLRIAAKVKIDKNILEETIWTDRSGVTRKTQMPALQQTTYRTNRETALRSADSQYDLGEKSVVKVALATENPHRTKEISYRMILNHGDVSNSFIEGATQKVRVVDRRMAEITVRSLRPTNPLGNAYPPDAPPEPADLAANALVQSDDPQVIELAQRFAPGKTEPWEIAQELERQVRQYVTQKNFSQAMASAADVVRSREGDCTEHSVLLTALCRARQIPARAAIGLVYSQHIGGFGYHMWTEAWIQDRWVPLDATLGLGGIGAAHLKVSQSNLQGVNPFSQFLPVFPLIGNLQIEVISIQ